jgi:uncharacterized membrane-anchored protein YhcB (DUF1043 family)
MKPIGLTVEDEAKWNEGVKRVLEQYPEARLYVELRQEWQSLYRHILDSSTPDKALETRERAAWSRMRAAYEELPVAVQAILVL